MEIRYDLVTEKSNEELIISKHAYSRMKERNGWSRKAAIRMIQKVYKEGRRPDQVKGYLKRWINNKVENGQEGKEFILFGEKLYVFNDNIMLTVLQVPTRGYLIKEA